MCSTSRKLFSLILAVMFFLCVIPQAFAYNTGDDYPYKNYNPDVAEEWNFLTRECTSFVAWCLNSRNGIWFHNRYKPGTDERLDSDINGGRWGNAYEWEYAASALGYIVDNTPAVGAVALWRYGSRGSWDTTGHVAWVRSVNGNGTIDIEQYTGYNTYVFKEETISVYAPSCYLHINDIPQTGTIDVNTILDGQHTGAGTVLNGVRYGTFDIYIDGVLYDDKDDISPTGCTSYQITDIKPTVGHIYSGSVGNLSGTVPAGQAVTVELKFDTCTNHTYDSGTVTKPSTCSESGVKTFTCTKCGSTKTETIPKLAHTPVVDPAVPATVTATGLTEGSHCSVCGTVIIAQQVVPKLPRVPYDFDMDGVAEPVMTLPGALKNIEASAFEGGTAKVVIIPDGTTTIGSRAFADMPSLIAVFIPESVTTISFDVFEGSPNVKLYVAKGSRWGARLNLPAVEIENGWVLADNVPMGAEITDRKWTYTTREYKESSSASYPGWTKYKTQKTWSAWSGWQNSEISASSDREVRTQTIVTGYNMISYCVSGPNGRSYQPSPTYTVRLQHGPYWWSKAELDSARVFYAGSYFDYESNVAGYVLDGTA